MRQDEMKPSLLPRNFRSVILKCGLLLTAWMLTGCGAESDGPARYAISGKVDFGGAPIPFGEIMFQPDAEKGNKGPGAMGQIEKGVYKIEAAEGPIGGAHIVRITGLDGKPTAGAAPVAGAAPAKPLFKEYQTTADLPKQATTKDFSVPKR